MVFLKTSQFSSQNHTDPVFELIDAEQQRQNHHLELIASENIVSEAVRRAQGSWLTNKYAEGYSGRRYYGGCGVVDQVEQLAEERAKALFQCSYANVQPHSGSSANLAVFFALLQPGDAFMALSLSSGGHLTHGASVNFSGRWFKAIPYDVDAETGRIDMDDVRRVALSHRPKMIIAGITAYTRPLDFEAFRKIADEVGAFLLVDMAHLAGLVATGAHASPFPHAHVVTSTTHKTLRGPRGGLILANDEGMAKKLKAAIFPGLQGGPLMHVIAAKAVAFGEAMAPGFQGYMAQVVANAKALASSLQQEGLKLVSGGTDNHMVLLDLRDFSFSGAKAEKMLEDIGIICNKNTVPRDARSPFETSGIRLGTPACTTRGLLEKDFQEIGQIIANLLKQADQGKEGEARAALSPLVEAMTKRYPL